MFRVYLPFKKGYIKFCCGLKKKKNRELSTLECLEIVSKHVRPLFFDKSEQMEAYYSSLKKYKEISMILLIPTNIINNNRKEQKMYSFVSIDLFYDT
jgi:hypothetical protein